MTQLQLLHSFPFLTSNFSLNTDEMILNNRNVIPWGFDIIRFLNLINYSFQEIILARKQNGAVYFKQEIHYQKHHGIFTDFTPRGIIPCGHVV